MANYSIKGPSDSQVNSKPAETLKTEGNYIHRFMKIWSFYNFQIERCDLVNYVLINTQL